MNKKYLDCNTKVRFKKDYDGYFSTYKNQILTVDWHHNEAECGEVNGRVVLKEIMEQPHLINPKWLEVVK